ncbi:MAG: hypothetical protein ACRDHL_12140 [Candidatus Promineifilaceae bacterium]
MPSSFDWKAEDERNWREYPAPAAGQPRRRARVWLRLGIVFLVLLSLALLGFGRLRDRVNQAEDSTTAAVRAAHDLAQRALVEDDVELLASLLSGRDPDWTQTQLSLLDLGLSVDRANFGLRWRSEAAAGTAEVSLSPDLNQAEAAVELAYVVIGPEGVTDTIRLRQTWLFRRSDQKWLLSPPEPEFWGQRIASRGRFLSLIFPERDAELGHELAADLEGVLAGACNRMAQEGAPCPDELALEVELSGDPAVLLDLDAADARLQASSPLVLPAPTLLGLPAEASDYPALLRAYAPWVLTALMNHLTHYRCCRQPMLRLALVDLQLNELGFQEWPASDDDYRQALRQSASLARLAELWEHSGGLNYLPADQRALAYALVAYLDSERPNFSPTSSLHWLNRTGSLEEWLALFSADAPGPAFMRDFQRFLQRRIYAGQGEAPIALPAEDLLLMCNDGVSGPANLYRYVMAGQGWQMEIADGAFVVMDSLPRHEGVLLVEHYVAADFLRTTLYRNGRGFDLLRGNSFLDYDGVADPSGRFIAATAVSSGPGPIGQNSIYDLDNCGPAECLPTPVNGIPAWAPDGQHMILTSGPGDAPLTLADAQGEAIRSLGTGRLPTWLDGTTLAYLGGDPAEGPAVLVQDVGGPAAEPRLILEADRLAATAGADSESEIELVMTQLLANPAEPGAVYILATGRVEPPGFVFRYQPDSDELALALHRGYSHLGMVGLGFSPGGRWLTLMASGNRAPDGAWYRSLYLLDTTTLETLSLPLDEAGLLPVQAWSADGRWLMQLGEGYFLLTAPEADYRHLIPIDFNDCTAAAWIRPRA